MTKIFFRAFRCQKCLLMYYLRQNTCIRFLRLEEIAKPSIRELPRMICWPSLSMWQGRIECKRATIFDTKKVQQPFCPSGYETKYRNCFEEKFFKSLRGSKCIFIYKLFWNSKSFKHLSINSWGIKSKFCSPTSSLSFIYIMHFIRLWSSFIFITCKGDVFENFSFWIIHLLNIEMNTKWFIWNRTT